MRVLLVTSYMRPHISGITEYVDSLAKSWAEMGHQVTVLTGRHSKSSRRAEMTAHYKIVRAPIWFRISKGYISPSFVIDFCRLQKSSEVVNFHLPLPEAGLMSFLTRRPIVASFHCDMALTGSMTERLAVIATQLSARIALRRARIIASMSKEYALTSRLVQGLESKLLMAPVPNRFGFTPQVRPSSPVRSIANRPKIIFAGRFAREKGIELIFEAARQMPHCDFALAGDFESVPGGSSLSNELNYELRALDNVEILGRISDQELQNLFGVADILLLPSVDRFEAFGLVQLEAMSQGVICVASNSPGIRDVITATGIGRLVTPGSADSLVEGINGALKDLALLTRGQIAEAAKREFGEAKFKLLARGLLEKLEKAN